MSEPSAWAPCDECHTMPSSQALYPWNGKHLCARCYCRARNAAEAEPTKAAKEERTDE